MEKYKDSDVELMSILLKLQEQTSPIRMSIGYTVGGTVRQLSTRALIPHSPIIRRLQLWYRAPQESRITSGLVRCRA